MPLAAASTPSGRGAPPALRGRRPSIVAFGGAGTDSVTSARAPRPDRDRTAEHEGHGAVADQAADLWVPFLVLTLIATGFGLIVLARDARP